MCYIPAVVRERGRLSLLPHWFVHLCSRQQLFVDWHVYFLYGYLTLATCNCLCGIYRKLRTDSFSDVYLRMHAHKHMSTYVCTYMQIAYMHVCVLTHALGYSCTHLHAHILTHSLTHS